MIALLLVVACAGAVLGAPSVTAEEETVFFPRCEDGMVPRPFFERVGPELAEPINDGDGFDWIPYRLRDSDFTCVYELVPPKRMDECLKDNWFISTGGSNQAVQAQYMLMHLLGNERMDPYFDHEDLSKWHGQVFQLRDFGAIMDFASPDRDIVCWGQNCEKNTQEHTPGHGYYSSLRTLTLTNVIEYFERIKPENISTFPTPTIFLGTDLWIAQCLPVMGKTSHWAYRLCESSFEDVKEDTPEAYLEAQIGYMHRNLAYFRDEWPHVKEVVQETNFYMRNIKPFFPPEVLQENNYPNVIWFENEIDFDEDVEGDFQQDYHWAGPIPFMRNQWWLDYMCRDTRRDALEYHEPYIYFREDCKAVDGLAFYDFGGCHTRFGGDTAPFQVPSVKVFSNQVLLDEPQLHEEFSPGRIELAVVYTPYHLTLVIGSLFALVIGAVASFKPQWLEWFCKSTGLTFVADKFLQCTAMPVRLLEEMLHASATQARTYLRRLATCALCSRRKRQNSTINDQSLFEQNDLPELNSNTKPQPSPIEKLSIEGDQTITLVGETSESGGPPASEELLLTDLPNAGNSEAVPSKSTSQFERVNSPVDGTKPKPLTKLKSLGMARYIASVHILLGHMRGGFTQSGNFKAYPIDDWYTSGWGFSWVPFFMMLSGFVLTYARANSSNPEKTEHWASFTLKRVRGIYPLFLCGILARAWQISFYTGAPFTLGHAYQAIPLLLLIQAWFPAVVVQGLQAHCWFLSCIVPYWAAHQAVYLRLRRWRTANLWLLGATCVVLPFLALTLIPRALGFSTTWYSTWDGWTMREGTHYLVAMLKFHPFFYFHIYVFGMISALLMQRMDQHHSAVQFLFRNGAIIGFFGLYLVFVISYWAVLPAYKLTCRLGALAPLQGLYLIGLAQQRDPLARFFALDIFSPLENLSYPQYVFQFVAFASWQSWMGLGFWLWISAISMFGYYFVQSPLKSALKPFRTQLAGFMNIFLLSALIGLSTLALVKTGAYQSFWHLSSLPRYADLGRGAWDKRLNEDIERAAVPVKFINPSLLWDENEGRMFIAARAHRYRQTTTYFRIDTRWDSDVYFGEVDPVTLEPLENLRSPFQEGAFLWKPCQPPYFRDVGNNGTYVRTVVTGPEDPRLMMLNGQVLLTANMFGPVRSKIGYRFADCVGNERMIGGMFDPVTDAFGDFKLMRYARSATAKEKNWMAFEHNGNLKFVQRIVPFTVVSQTTKGSFSDSDEASVELAVESVVLQQSLSTFIDGKDVVLHGGANPLAVQRENETFVWPVDTLSGDVSYLGVFHTLAGNGTYTNYFFEFGLQEPAQVWTIMRISSPINVLGSTQLNAVSRAMTFLSGLTATEQGVFLSYGSSNSEARVRFLPWEVVSDHFSSSDSEQV